MQFKSSLLVLSTFLVLLVTKECQSQTLYCYVCEDCMQLTQDTPKEVCNAEFFNPDKNTTAAPETTDSTTTENPTTETETASTDTETAETTTTEKPSPSTPGIPTPPTGEPPSSTTPLPTPPTPGVLPPVAIVETFNATNATNQLQQLQQQPSETSSPMAPMPTTMLPLLKITQAPSTILVRQRRDAVNQMYVYNCYTIKKLVNDSVITSRGCARANADEKICNQLQSQNNDTKLTSCFQCQNPYCNSSTSLSISLFAMIFGLIAVSSIRSLV